MQSWKGWMLMRSSLKALSGHRVRIAATSRVRSGSPVTYLLQAEPGFTKTVSAAQVLAKRHLPLWVAKAVVERLLEKENVTIEIPRIENAKSFEAELEEFGIKAIHYDSGEGKRQRHIDRIVGRYIMPQSPDAPQQEVVRVTVQREIQQIVQGLATAPGFDPTARSIAAQHLHHLDIDQMGRMQRLLWAEQAVPHSASGRCAQQHFQKRRGVDHDHRESRSARIASSGDRWGSVAGRFSRRSRSSAKLGRSATRRNSASR